MGHFEVSIAALGYEDRRQPDWFRENETAFKPLLKERNRLHTLWLNTGKERDRVKHARARWAVRKLMRKAKNDWFLHKALEAEKGRHGGKLVWHCIRDIQRGRRGLVPARTAVAKDEEGNVCTTM